ncbi:hypothetical protein [Bosea sp. 117]|uniref:hypothetical protein n=1 Tax=Bosea sp. 117 TaxID=1125973 RepID=UPI000494B7A6|nr:hypothetical protein [Bosea sp. 117]
MRTRLAAALLLATLATPPAQAQVRSVELYAPRPFGYVIGDAIALTVEIALDPPFVLDAASLPRPRALDYWLDLREARLTDHGVSAGTHRYTLDLVYQTLYAPLEPKRLAIPGLALAATDGGRRVAIDVPAWSFLSSPLREIVSTGAGAPMALRPDIEPRPIATAGALRGLVASTLAALAALALLAWRMGWGPFGRRQRRPFAGASRTVRAALHASSSSAYRAALLALHRAFDATAGKRVLAEDLPAFFEAHPAFRATETEVCRLFDASRRAFFGEDAAGAQGELPAPDLVALARRLRAIERGTA